MEVRLIPGKKAEETLKNQEEGDNRVKDSTSRRRGNDEKKKQGGGLKRGT